MDEIFEELKQGVKKHTLYEQRALDRDYVEVVFFSKDQELWDDLLTNLFGNPLKPAGTSPSKEARAFAQVYGGIFENQTLYYLHSGRPVIAMLWPWQDGVHVTLKAGKLPAV